MYELRSGAFLTPHGRQVTMEYRDGTNDWNTLNASLNADEYHLPEGLSGTALDVGGYLGSVGIALALDNPDLLVTIVEPVPANGDLIERNIALNGVGDRVTLIRGAVGKGGEPVSVWFGYVGNPTAEHHAFVGNSSLAYDHGGELPHQEVEYTALQLSDFVNDIDLRLYGPYTDKGGPNETHPVHDTIFIDFLKIDCEGAEWAFLESPEIWRVQYIVGEAHSVRGRKGGDIVGLLEATHDVTLSGDAEGTCEFSAVRR